MLSEEFRPDARRAVARLAFSAQLRRGRIPADLMELSAEIESDFERKFNPNHDPRNGQFTFAPGGPAAISDRTGGRSPSIAIARKPRSYTGMTAKGVGVITATSGGYIDRNGRWVPEMFPPDPYRLSDPVSAVAHYVGKSGEARNYYFGRLDTSSVTAESFPAITRRLREGKPGIYAIIDAERGFETNSEFGPHYTIGGINLRTDGVLVIAKDGDYSFSGRLGASPDNNDYNERTGRTPYADATTAVGRMLPGKPFRVFMIGSKPLNATGSLASGRQ